MQAQPGYRHATKPPRGAQVDREPPLTRGLVDLLIYNEGTGPPFNLAASAPATLLGAPLNAPSWTPTPDGTGLRPSGLIAVSQSTASAAAIPDRGGYVAGDLTLRVRYRLNAAPTAAFSGLLVKSTSSATREVAIFLNTAGNVSTTALGRSSNSVIFATGQGLGKTVDLVLTRAGSTCQYYSNGVPVGATSTLAGTTATATPLIVGGQGENSAVEQNPDVTVTQFAAWNRALSAGDVARLWRDPYALILPPSTRRWAAGLVGATPGPRRPLLVSMPAWAILAGN